MLAERLPFESVAFMGAQIAKALAVAHAAGIVHRAMLTAFAVIGVAIVSVNNVGEREAKAKLRVLCFERK